MPFLRQYAHNVRHNVRYVGILPAWQVDCASRLRVSALTMYTLRSALPRSVKGRQLSAVDTLFYLSWVCIIVNSLHPTFNKYILSVLRLSIEAILGVGSGFATLPFSLIKSTSSERNIYIQNPNMQLYEALRPFFTHILPSVSINQVYSRLTICIHDYKALVKG